MIALTALLRVIVPQKTGSVLTDRSNLCFWQGNSITWCPWLDGSAASAGAVMALYFSLQFWLPRPYLLGASDRGAKRERHHSRLTAWKLADSSRTLLDFLIVLALDMTQLQVVLWDCPSHKRWLKTKTSADRRLMLQQSPYHSIGCSAMCSFTSRVQLIPVLYVEKYFECSAFLYYTISLSLLAVGLIRCTCLRALWLVGIHGTYTLLRNS